MWHSRLSASLTFYRGTPSWIAPYHRHTYGVLYDESNPSIPWRRCTNNTPNSIETLSLRMRKSDKIRSYRFDCAIYKRFAGATIPNKCSEKMRENNFIIAKSLLLSLYISPITKFSNFPTLHCESPFVSFKQFAFRA